MQFTTPRSTVIALSPFLRNARTVAKVQPPTQWLLQLLLLVAASFGASLVAYGCFTTGVAFVSFAHAHSSMIAALAATLITLSLLLATAVSGTQIYSVLRINKN